MAHDDDDTKQEALEKENQSLRAKVAWLEVLEQDALFECDEYKAQVEEYEADEAANEEFFKGLENDRELTPEETDKVLEAAGLTKDDIAKSLRQAQALVRMAGEMAQAKEDCSLWESRAKRLLLIGDKYLRNNQEWNNAVDVIRTNL
jgi:hypothetical protein